MATKCLFCLKSISPNRKRYCSVACIKRAWYVRNLHPESKSFFTKHPDFWKTETGVGLKWEKIAAQLLGAKHLGFQKGADLNWNGKLVDVKSSNLYKRKYKKGKIVQSIQDGYWIFNRNKPKEIDFFFCITLIENKFYKAFLIPNNSFPQKGTTIGWKSKYEQYLWPKP